MAASTGMLKCAPLPKNQFGPEHQAMFLDSMSLPGKSVKTVNVGVRSTFADLAATIADLLSVKAPPQGKSFKELII